MKPEAFDELVDSVREMKEMMSDQPEGWACVCTDGPCKEFPCKSYGGPQPLSERVRADRCTPEKCSIAAIVSTDDYRCLRCREADEIAALEQHLDHCRQQMLVDGDRMAALEQERLDAVERREFWRKKSVTQGDTIRDLRAAIAAVSCDLKLAQTHLINARDGVSFVIDKSNCPHQDRG